MSYRYREGLELVSEAISNLKFRDMWMLADYIADCVKANDGSGEDTDAYFFAHSLLHWAEDVNENYDNRVKEGGK